MRRILSLAFALTVCGACFLAGVFVDRLTDRIPALENPVVATEISSANVDRRMSPQAAMAAYAASTVALENATAVHAEMLGEFLRTNEDCTGIGMATDLTEAVIADLQRQVVMLREIHEACGSTE